MKTTTRANLRANLAPLLAELGETKEPIMILSTEKQNNPTIIITKARYDELIKMESEK